MTRKDNRTRPGSLPPPIILDRIRSGQAITEILYEPEAGLDASAVVSLTERSTESGASRRVDLLLSEIPAVIDALQKALEMARRQP